MDIRMREGIAISSLIRDSLEERVELQIDCRYWPRSGGTPWKGRGSCCLPAMDVTRNPSCSLYNNYTPRPRPFQAPPDMKSLFDCNSIKQRVLTKGYRHLRSQSPW